MADDFKRENEILRANQEEILKAFTFERETRIAYESVLKFYANPETYQSDICEITITGDNINLKESLVGGEIAKDKGEKARVVLLK